MTGVAVICKIKESKSRKSICSSGTDEATVFQPDSPIIIWEKGPMAAPMSYTQCANINTLRPIGSPHTSVFRPSYHYGRDTIPSASYVQF